MICQIDAPCNSFSLPFTFSEMRCRQKGRNAKAIAADMWINEGAWLQCIVEVLAKMFQFHFCVAIDTVMLVMFLSEGTAFLLMAQ